jgi:hypothetical protein
MPHVKALQFIDKQGPLARAALVVCRHIVISRRTSITKVQVLLL